MQLTVVQSRSSESDGILFASQDGSALHLTLIGPSRARAYDADDRQTLEVVAGQLADACNLERQAAEKQALLGDLERQRSELAALVAQLIQAQEQERQRVALDLHDGSAQPILVLTADATLPTRRRALSLGAKDFLTKPFDAIEAVLRIFNLLETRILTLELARHGLATPKSERPWVDPPLS
ncbi:MULTISPECIES: hypothetical protein [unclassified Rhizobium]|uniref:hypothetical protein n=1 Tax=unclassified Rhizobium TaxID=2613769 RepID=UPI001FEFA7DD|nr:MULTISPECIES: hypothetical protein [unclassified Rhizobium]